ncbi:MAG: hypothetical protein OSB62_03060 [Alphaproteobacteria bacterium]|jgi:hypothetical protein|nr:hypothetical protein [Alphaproteobacteria bacterium]
MNIESDHDRQKVKEYFKQALSVNRSVDEAKAELKDILDVLNEQHEIKPSISRKVLKAMEKGNMPEMRHLNEQFEDLYQAVIR